MIYLIYIQRMTSVHLKPKFDLIYINLHLYLLIHLLYVLYSASIHHAGISAIEKQFYYYYYYLDEPETGLAVWVLVGVDEP